MQGGEEFRPIRAIPNDRNKVDYKPNQKTNQKMDEFSFYLFGGKSYIFYL
jgi:hypothetical protein